MLLVHYLRLNYLIGENVASGPSYLIEHSGGYRLLKVTRKFVHSHGVYRMMFHHSCKWFREVANRGTLLVPDSPA